MCWFLIHVTHSLFWLSRSICAVNLKIKTKEAVYRQCNTEVHSHNLWCFGKAVHLYSCCSYPACQLHLLRRVISASVACLILSMKFHGLDNKCIEHKLFILIFLQLLSEIFFILWRIHWVSIINVFRSLCKIPVLQYKTSWKCVQWEPRCSVRTDRHDEAGSFFTILLTLLRSYMCMFNNCCDMKLVLWHLSWFWCLLLWDMLQVTQNVWETFSASIRWCSPCVFELQINVNSCLQEAILHKFLLHLGWRDWLFIMRMNQFTDLTKTAFVTFTFLIFPVPASCAHA